jgi:hypothetical protein
MDDLPHGSCDGTELPSRKLAWIHPDQAKARKAIAVPLNDTAVGVVRAQKAKHPTRVFQQSGNGSAPDVWYRL